MENSHTFWSIITSRIFLVITTLALVAVGVGIFKGAARRIEVQKEINALQKDIGALESKNDDLTKLLKYFGTAEFKEREARLRLGLQKPGENVVVIPGLEDSVDKPSGGVANQNDITTPNWRRWLDYFFSQSSN